MKVIVNIKGCQKIFRNDNQSLYELITVIGKGVEETLEIWNSRFVDLKQIKKRHK